jgi:ribosomal protein S17E
MAKKKDGYVRQGLDMIKDGWEWVGKKAEQHPWIASTLEIFTLFSDDEAEEAMEDISRATNTKFETMKQLVETMQTDSNVQHLVLDSLGARLKHGQLYRTIPKRFRAENVKRVAKILSDRWSNRRELLDDKAIVTKPESEAAYLLQIQTIKTVQQFMGVHNMEATMQLHSALRAFVNTDSKAISTVLGIMELSN